MKLAETRHLVIHIENRGMTMVSFRADGEQPLTGDENALAGIADWGPAEDWADWADAPR